MVRCRISGGRQYMMSDFPKRYNSNVGISTDLSKKCIDSGQSYFRLRIAVFSIEFLRKALILDSHTVWLIPLDSHSHTVIHSYPWTVLPSYLWAVILAAQDWCVCNRILQEKLWFWTVIPSYLWTILPLDSNTSGLIVILHESYFLDSHTSGLVFLALCVICRPD